MTVDVEQLSQRQRRFQGEPAHLAGLLAALTSGGADGWAHWRAEAEIDTLHLRAIDLEGCELAGFDFAGADLQGARLGATDLQGADLRGANLMLADLTGADLRGACLDDAVATGTYFAQADLRGASFKRVDVGEGHMKKARLDGAQLHGAQLQWTRAVNAAMLAVADGDAATGIPEATPRPAHWTASA